MSNFLWPHGLQYGSQASLSLTISQRVWMTAIQLCPTFSDPMDCSLPDSSVHGIVQTRILKWTSISFSRGSSWPRGQTQVSCIAGRFYYLPEFVKTHVHEVRDAIQPSHLLLFPSPPAFIFPSIRVFPRDLALCIRWPKYWSFSISSFNEYSVLISFRIDLFDLLAVQGKSFRNF